MCADPRWSRSLAPPAVSWSGPGGVRSPRGSGRDLRVRTAPCHALLIDGAVLALGIGRPSCKLLDLFARRNDLADAIGGHTASLAWDQPLFNIFVRHGLFSAVDRSGTDPVPSQVHRFRPVWAGEIGDHVLAFLLRGQALGVRGRDTHCHGRGFLMWLTPLHNQAGREESPQR